MKKYRINVNGNMYEVEVEEIGGASGPVVIPTGVVSVPTSHAPVYTPSPVSVPKSPATPPVSAPKAAVTSAPAGGADTITSPMPGKVLSIKVGIGQIVKDGDLILILEAMKMENEIYCSKSGKIAEICVNEGAFVNAGEILVKIN